MSGGSWNYACWKIQEWANELMTDKNPLRRAFGQHMELIANAMHDIEWVDLCDYGPDQESDAIRAALGPDADRLELAVLVSDARQAADKLNQAIERAEGGKEA